MVGLPYRTFLCIELLIYGTFDISNLRHTALLVHRIFDTIQYAVSNASFCSPSSAGFPVFVILTPPETRQRVSTIQIVSILFFLHRYHHLGLSEHRCNRDDNSLKRTLALSPQQGWQRITSHPGVVIIHWGYLLPLRVKLHVKKKCAQERPKHVGCDRSLI